MKLTHLPLHASHVCNSLFRNSLLAISFILLSSSLTSAQTIWTGTTNSDWEEDSNWSTGFAPTSTDHVVIDNVLPHPVLSGTGEAMSVRLNAGASLTIDPGAAIAIGLDGLATNGLSNGGGTVTNNGVINLKSKLFNNGPFVNGGIIIIESFIQTGVFNWFNQDGIFNAHELTNLPGAEIHIDQPWGNGIWNRGPNADIQNYGLIVQGANFRTGISGILNDKIIHNHAGGEILIDRPTRSGLVNRFNGVFTNDGLLVIGENNTPPQFGIVNDPDILVNNACGQIIVYNNLSNNGSLTNDGLLSLITTEANINTGSWVNEGIVHTTHTDLLAAGSNAITNNEIIVSPSSLTSGCEIYSPAFDLGAPVDFSIGIYSDENASISAGSFDPGSNTFTAYPILSDGTHDLYVSIGDQANSCTRIVSWSLTTQKIISNTQTDSDCDGICDINDACDGGNDAVDNNGDGLPDCAFPPDYEDIIDEWKCGNNKVYMTVNPNNPHTICVNKNSIPAHIANGGYLGPMGNASCDDNGDRKSLHETPWDNTTMDHGLSFEIYPNPAHDVLQVLVPVSESTKTEISIYDPMGRMVFQESIDNSSISIDISKDAFTTGLYLLRYKQGSNAESKQFIVIK